MIENHTTYLPLPKVGLSEQSLAFLYIPPRNALYNDSVLLITIVLLTEIICVLYHKDIQVIRIY